MTKTRKVTATPTTVHEGMGRIALGNYILVRNINEILQLTVILTPVCVKLFKPMKVKKINEITLTVKKNKTSKKSCPKIKKSKLIIKDKTETTTSKILKKSYGKTCQ